MQIVDYGNAVQALTPVSTWRLWWRSLASVFVRTAAPGVADGAKGKASEPVKLGADYAGGHETRPSFDVDASMSAFAAFPWVYAAVMRGASDIAGLPLKVVQGRGAKRKVLDDHPLYALLDQPSLRVTGRQLREQQYVDFTLVGNWIATMDLIGRRPVSVLRLHPKRVYIDPDPLDGWGDYIYNGAGQRYRLPADRILHVRTPSWTDDPRGLWGTGAIESLNDELETDRSASRSAKVLARRGRPDIIVSPKDSEFQQTWDDDFRKALKERLDSLLEGGGTVVLGGAAKIDMPAWTPRDIEFPALRQLVREAVLAVTGVPPHLVGLPVANYAQSEAQERSYWERQVAKARAIEDACWNPLARRFGSDLYVVHDLSGVDVLQAARTARLTRVQQWWFMGADPKKAAAAEGFDDAPFPDVIARPPVASVPKLAPGWVQRALSTETTVTRAYVAPRTEEARAAAWRGFVETLHGPTERRYAAVLVSFLRDQVARIVERAESLPTERGHLVRGVEEDIVEQLFPEAVEDKALAQAMRDALERALRESYTVGADRVGRPMAWDPIRIDVAVDEMLGSLVTNVQKTTSDAVASIVRSTVLSGGTVADMQAELQRAAAFGPSRALLIARTETTTSVNAGARQAYRDAVADGVKIRRSWLSSRDSEVRHTHLAIDGTVVDVDAEFVLADGDHGAGPGAMGRVANNANCRCTELPEMED